MPGRLHSRISRGFLLFSGGAEKAEWVVKGSQDRSRTGFGHVGGAELVEGVLRRVSMFSGSWPVRICERCHDVVDLDFEAPLASQGQGDLLGFWPGGTAGW